MNQKEKDLDSALQKMGFGSSLGESLIALKLALELEPLSVLESVGSFNLTEEEEKITKDLMSSYISLKMKNGKGTK